MEGGNSEAPETDMLAEMLRNLRVMTFEDAVSMLLSFIAQTDDSAVRALLIEYPQIFTLLSNFVQNTLAEPPSVIQEWDQRPIGTRRLRPSELLLLLTYRFSIPATPPEPPEAPNLQDDAESSSTDLHVSKSKKRKREDSGRLSNKKRLRLETKCAIAELFECGAESSQDESQMEVDSEPQVLSAEEQSYIAEPVIFSREISEALYRAYFGADGTTQKSIQTWTKFYLRLQDEDFDQSHIGVSLSQALRDALLRFPDSDSFDQTNVLALIMRLLPNIEAKWLVVLERFMD